MKAGLGAAVGTGLPAGTEGRGCVNPDSRSLQGLQGRASFLSSLLPPILSIHSLFPPILSIHPSMEANANTQEVMKIQHRFLEMKWQLQRFHRRDMTASVGLEARGQDSASHTPCGVGFLKMF